MAKVRTTSDRTKTIYVLVDLERNIKAVTGNIRVAEMWSENGGDYHETHYIYNTQALDTVIGE